MIQKLNSVIEGGYNCPHCGTVVGAFESHDCYMKHLHERMKNKNKKHLKKKI